MNRKDTGLKSGLRWGFGCAVATAGVFGLVTIAFVLSFVFNPPLWIQIGLGVVFPLLGLGLAWLIATSLRKREDAAPGPSPIPPPEQDPEGKR